MASPAKWSGLVSRGLLSVFPPQGGVSRILTVDKKLAEARTAVDNLFGFRSDGCWLMVGEDGERDVRISNCTRYFRNNGINRSANNDQFQHSAAARGRIAGCQSGWLADHECRHDRRFSAGAADDGH